MSLDKPLPELVEELTHLATKAPEEEVRSILLYAIKQLKIARVAYEQDQESN